MPSKKASFMNTDKLLVYTSVFTIMGLSDAVIPVLPELASANHTSYGAAASSLLFSAYFMGALITMLPFGILSDKYGNIRFVVLGMLLTFISGILLLVSDNLWVLAVTRFIEGSACGAFFPAAFSMLSEFRNRNRCMGEFNFLLNAGLATGVFITGFLAKINIKYGILLFTIVSMIVLIMGISKLISTQPPPAKIRKDIGQEISIEVKKTFNTLFDKYFINIWILSFVLFGATGVLVAFYPDYSANFLTKSELGTAIAGLYVCAMITSFMVSRMLVSYRVMIRTGMGITAIGALIAIWHPMLGFSILGGGSGVAMVGLPIAASRMDTDRGLTMGLFNTCTYGGLALMPIGATALIGHLGFEGIFLINALIVGLSLFLKE
jgi:MFS family permease